MILFGGKVKRKIFSLPPFVPYPCSRVRVRSRETGLAVPSRVSPLIFSTIGLNTEESVQLAKEREGFVGKYLEILKKLQYAHRWYRSVLLFTQLMIIFGGVGENENEQAAPCY